jgi:disulfide oxidoreductase YuzD
MNLTALPFARASMAQSLTIGGTQDCRSCGKSGSSRGMIDMAKKSLQQKFPNLVEKFKQSAMDYYSACDSEAFSKQKIVIGRTNKIVDSLDSVGDEGRLALVLTTPTRG